MESSSFCELQTGFVYMSICGFVKLHYRNIACNIRRQVLLATIVPVGIPKSIGHRTTAQQVLQWTQLLLAMADRQLCGAKNIRNGLSLVKARL